MSRFKNYTIEYGPNRKVEIPRTRRLTNIICLLISFITLVLAIVWTPGILAGFILGIFLVAVIALDALATSIQRTAERLKHIERVEWEE